MSNYIFIQTSSLSNYYLEKEFEAFSDIPEVTLVPFGIIPFTNPSIITGLDNFIIKPQDKVFIRGGTLLASKNFIIPNNPLLTEVFKNNIFHNDDWFNYKVIHYWYRSKGKLHKLLNNSIKFSKCIDIKDTIMTKDTFFKPITDLKDFGGLIVNSGSTLNDSISKIMHKDNWESCEVLYTDKLVDIVAEYRFFFVKNKLISGSQYMKNKKLYLQGLSDHELYCAAEWLKGYVPDQSGNFVVDIAKLSDSTYRIIEYNCLNCSGLYNINSKELAYAIFR